MFQKRKRERSTDGYNNHGFNENESCQSDSSGYKVVSAKDCVGTAKPEFVYKYVLQTPSLIWNNFLLISNYLFTAQITTSTISPKTSKTSLTYFKALIQLIIILNSKERSENAFTNNPFKQSESNNQTQPSMLRQPTHFKTKQLNIGPYKNNDIPFYRDHDKWEDIKAEWNPKYAVNTRQSRAKEPFYKRALKGDSLGQKALNDIHSKSHSFSASRDHSNSSNSRAVFSRNNFSCVSNKENQNFRSNLTQRYNVKLSDNSTAMGNSSKLNQLHRMHDQQHNTNFNQQVRTQHRNIFQNSGIPKLSKSQKPHNSKSISYISSYQ